MKLSLGRDPNLSGKSETISALVRVAGVFLIVYGLVAVGAHFYSLGVLFQPGYGSRLEPNGMLRIPQPDGDSLAAIYLPNPAAKYTLWFFHGNAEDLGDVEPFLLELRSRGYAVFAYDYPGYGLSKGFPGEKSIYAATLTASRYLHEKLQVPSSAVIIYGRSLGGGPAVELAEQEPAAGLVLQSTFTSVYRVFTNRRVLPFDKFENLRKLPRVSCPVLVMHGGHDAVIPFAHGLTLYAAVAGKKAALWVDEAGHNDFVQAAGQRYWEALRKFTDSL